MQGGQEEKDSLTEMEGLRLPTISEGMEEGSAEGRSIGETSVEIGAAREDHTN